MPRSSQEEVAFLMSQEVWGKILFLNAMKGEWEEVKEAYRSQSSEVQKMKITRAGDTALHIAASYGLTKIVLQLLEIIGDCASKSNILKIENDKGNTPLHLAATIGDVEMCHAMTTIDPDLVSSRNHENETPLFLAALHGKEKAFFCLHSHCEQNCHSFRTKNGDTILHAAISGEYLSLAFQIILWHPHLVNYMNESGFSPLHILANTPSAFNSSSRLRPLDRLIYKCLIVEELKGEEDIKKICPQEKQPESNINMSSESDQTSLDPKTKKKSDQTLTNSWRNICCSPSPTKRGNKNEAARDAENPPQATNQRPEQERKSHPNYIYASFVNFLCLIITKALVEIDRFLPSGILSIDKINGEKRRHKWATQVMKELVKNTSSYMSEQTPGETRAVDDESFEEVPNKPVTESGEETKMGVSEMVDEILEHYPVAIQDVDSENKNVALLAVENRQPHVYKLLLKREKQIESLLRQVDKTGNNALHLAAKYGSYRPWLTPGAALQMQWELKWFTFVQTSMPSHLSVRSNIEGQTPKEIFTTSHKPLQKEGSNWLVKTSESCSVVAALIATVAFATSATVPGGLDNETGEPVFKDKPAFDAFTISSLVSLCLSVTALVFFLSIITSRYEAHDFSINLPRKLLLGLTSLFASIASVLVSFCTGHLFLLDRQLRYVAYPLYAATCLPVTIFALAQLPLYYDLIRVMFGKVPQRSYKEYRHY
ncbi:uncharacterized protein LOC110749617 [Prunus avium]|uniref:Uncharacterized protein LOC110749617 n=1 Tax=Prunus avium TaxID=42229 RepID=A0A6P5RUT5_PRUAV|nr:uncharacterized protein LOC110749617 [Prunus avium]